MSGRERKEGRRKPKWKMEAGEREKKESGGGGEKVNAMKRRQKTERKAALE